MASAIDAFNEALNEDKAWAKVVGYAVPAYFFAKSVVNGNSEIFSVYGVACAILYFALLTVGINNVRMNKREIISINPWEIIQALIKTAIVLIPHLAVCGLVGSFLTNRIVIPIDIANVQKIYSIIVWSLLGSIVLTSYLSFAKYLRITQGFNYKLISESCVDILISVIFFIPQWIVANLIIVGPVVYLFYFFNLPFNHWSFIAYCSGAFVINVSILANYFAQVAYEFIKGNNEEYADNVQLNVIDTATERMN